MFNQIRLNRPTIKFDDDRIFQYDLDNNNLDNNIEFGLAAYYHKDQLEKENWLMITDLKQIYEYYDMIIEENRCGGINFLEDVNSKFNCLSIKDD